MSPGAGGGRVAGSQPISTANGAQVNLGDLTPYLTFSSIVILSTRKGEGGSNAQFVPNET